jgi:hypothetical protein
MTRISPYRRPSGAYGALSQPCTRMNVVLPAATGPIVANAACVNAERGGVLSSKEERRQSSSGRTGFASARYGHRPSSIQLRLCSLSIQLLGVIKQVGCHGGIISQGSCNVRRHVAVRV